MGHFYSNAQEIWTLESCLDSALKNNTEIAQSLLRAEIAAIQTLQAKNNFTPSVNGYAGHSFNYGRNLDPVSNSFTQTQRQNTSFTLSGDWLLFNGMVRYYSLKKTKLELENVALSKNIAERNVKLSVLTFYLQALLSKELIALSKEHLNYTLQEQKRIEEMILLESKTKIDLIEVLSQKAREELALTQAENENELILLQLKQVMQVPSTATFQIDTSFQALFLDTNLFKPIGALPEIQQSEIALEQATLEVKKSQSTYFPSLSVSAGIGSGFSDGYYLLDPISGDAYVPTFPVQFSQNVYQNIIFSLSIPIYNQNRTKSATQMETIALENIELEKEILIRELNGTIHQLQADIKNAKAELKATATLLTYANLDFNQSQIRFQNGIINYSELLAKKDRLYEAQSKLVQSKYNYYFKQKILMLYYE